jgi:hypothetical protein
MKLTEIIVSITIASLFAPVFASAAMPVINLRRQTALLKEELHTNHFISESFYALSTRDGDFETWQNLMLSVTGCRVKVTKTRFKNIYRAEWEYKNKPLFIEAEFNLDKGDNNVH